MKVVLAAVGSRGDTVPFGALASRLRREGHDVVMLAHASLASAVPDDVPVVPVPSDPGELLAGPAAEALRAADPRALNRARGLFADFLASVARPSADVLPGADVLVASTFAVAAVDVALDLGVPVARAHLWPENPTVDGPMPLLPYAWSLPGPLRRSARRSLRRMEGYLAGFEGWWERGRLRLQAHHPAGFTTSTLGSMHAVSPSLVDPEDVDGCVTGWWVPEHTGPVGRDIAARLAEGTDPWIYVGFGSMHQAHPDRLLEDVVWAAQRTGVRAVVQLPGAEALADSRILGVGEEPHDDLFPRTSLVVHHGGSGTTGAAVRAGVPSVVVPHFADQYYWGHRLHRIGTAPRPVPRALLTRTRLARAIDAGLTPPRRARAAEVGDRVRHEDGTGVAAQHLLRLVTGVSR